MVLKSALEFDLIHGILDADDDQGNARGWAPNFSGLNIPTFKGAGQGVCMDLVLYLKDQVARFGSPRRYIEREGLVPDCASPP